MRKIEQSEQRDAALMAMLPRVAEHGWTLRALRVGLADLGLPREEADHLFTGRQDMIEAYFDLADRRMAAGALHDPAMEQASLTRRVRALIALRLEQAQSERAPIAHAAAILALPASARLLARITARTVDAIWHEAGDRAADFSWYTKRAILAAVYHATMLYWLNNAADLDPGNAATLGFLDRRLADAGRIGRLRGRLTQAFRGIVPKAHLAVG